MKRPPGHTPDGGPPEAPRRAGAWTPGGERADGAETQAPSELRAREARPRAGAELHPGEETQALPGGLLREAVLEAVRALERRTPPPPPPRAASGGSAGSEASEKAADRAAPSARARAGAGVEEVPRPAAPAAAQGSLQGVVHVRGGAGELVALPLDPVALARAYRTPERFGPQALRLGEAFRFETGAAREEVIDYLARVFAGAGDLELGRAALLDLAGATGDLDVYPLEVVVHALERYPWFLPTAGFGHVFSGRAARGASLETDTDTPLQLEHAATMRVKSFAVVGGARPGHVFEPDARPSAYRLELHTPGEWDLLVSGVGRSGYLVIDRLSVAVRPGVRRGPERGRPRPPPRDAAEVAAWPMPPAPEVDVVALLDAAPARAPEPTMLSHQELIARKAKRGAPRPAAAEPGREASPRPAEPRSSAESARAASLPAARDAAPRPLQRHVQTEPELVDPWHAGVPPEGDLEVPEDPRDATMLLSSAVLDARPKTLPLRPALDDEAELEPTGKPSRPLPIRPPGAAEPRPPAKGSRAEATVIFTDKGERSERARAPVVAGAAPEPQGRAERLGRAPVGWGDEPSRGPPRGGEALPRLPPEVAREATRVMLDPSAPPLPVASPAAARSNPAPASRAPASRASVSRASVSRASVSRAGAAEPPRAAAAGRPNGGTRADLPGARAPVRGPEEASVVERSAVRAPVEPAGAARTSVRGADGPNRAPRPRAQRPGFLERPVEGAWGADRADAWAASEVASVAPVPPAPGSPPRADSAEGPPEPRDATMKLDASRVVRALDPRADLVRVETADLSGARSEDTRKVKVDGQTRRARARDA